MEKLDQDLQRRVWQRVKGSEEAPSPAALLLEERLDESALRRLGLGELAEGCAARAGMLRGICRLAGLREPALPGRLPAQSLSQRTLLGRMLERCRRYEAMAENPEFAPIYRCLQEQTQAACGKFARILGNTPLHKGL